MPMTEPGPQESNEYPQLAANEYFCLKVAEKCGLDVPLRRTRGISAMLTRRKDQARKVVLNWNFLDYERSEIWEGSQERLQ